MFQRCAVEKFHGDEGAAFGLINFVDRANVWMIQSGSGFRFALKPVQCVRISPHFIGQKFERDKAAELQIFGFVHHTHSTAAQFFDDAVVRNRLADQRRKTTIWRRC